MNVRTSTDISFSDIKDPLSYCQSLNNKRTIRKKEKRQRTEGKKSTEYPFQGRRENTRLWVLLLLNSASEETFQDQYMLLQLLR